MTIHVAFRGYADGVLQFEETAEFEESQIDQVIPSLAVRHARALACHQLHMIEVEFLDEPDPNARFFRVGTDPRGMAIPMAVRVEN